MDGSRVKYGSPGVKIECRDPEQTTSNKEMETEDYDDEERIEPSNFLEIGLTIKSEKDENFFNVNVMEGLEDYDPDEYSEELFLNPKDIYEDFEVSDFEYFFGSYLIKPCFVNLHNGIDSIDIRNCNICKKLKESKNNQIEYQCDMCPKKFRNKLGIKLHICHHLNPQSVDKGGKKEEEVKENGEDEEEEEEESLDCVYCCAKFKSDEELENHIKVHKPNKSYECTWCKEKFRSRHYFYKHECKEKKVLFECSTCRQIFFNESELAHHKAAHTLSMFDCNICGKYFYYKSDLTRHSVVHNASRQFPCSFCPNKYSSLNYLHDHEKNHMGIKRYFCEVCDKNYFWESQYKKHVIGSRHKKRVEIASKANDDD